jgi:hypothetical protein
LFALVLLAPFIFLLLHHRTALPTDPLHVACRYARTTETDLSTADRRGFGPSDELGLGEALDRARYAAVLPPVLVEAARRFDSDIFAYADTGDDRISARFPRDVAGIVAACDAAGISDT